MFLSFVIDVFSDLRTATADVALHRFVKDTECRSIDCDILIRHSADVVDEAEQDRRYGSLEFVIERVPVDNVIEPRFALLRRQTVRDRYYVEFADDDITLAIELLS